MRRRFFIGSVGKPGEGYDDENFERCKNMQAHVMHKDTKQKGVFNNVNAGDIFFLKYKDVLVAYGEVSSREVSNDDNLKGWTYLVRVKAWHFCSDSNSSLGVVKYGINDFITDGAQMATIKEIDQNWGLEKIKEIEALSGKTSPLYYEILKENNMDQYVSILSNNYNLILTGAPGTGKTYLAKKIAQQLIFGEVKEHLTNEEQKQYDEQCGFVQFHPSYDYTDFVEGLRPIKQGGTVGFQRKDGVFKEFCKKVLQVQLNASFEKLYKSIVDDIANGTITTYTTLSNIVYPLKVDKGVIKYGCLNNGNDYRSENVDNIKLIYEHFLVHPEDIDYSFNGLRGLISKLTDGEISTLDPSEYSWTIKELLSRRKQLLSQKYVFIIDEINRGEISKIFGELFYSIDPGYRGEKGKVDTQYQNLIPKEGDCDYDSNKADAFRNGFYVPSNVYIIGTMNDIDRSVESMDFAMRRRFAFKDIKAEDRIEMLDDLQWKEDAVERMKKLNTAIEKIEGLSSAYHIGPAYFLKLKNYDGDFDQLWEHHIEGLLFEYMRGMTDVNANLKALANAYGYSKANNYDQSSNN